MANTTRKKVKIVGKKQYLDPTTGEVSDFQVINIEERDANFHKIWLSNVI
ncbi:replication/maintenance protein RepL, partial [Escherichia coli]